MYNIHGEVAGLYLYYDASIPFWEGEHFPYACSAIIILVVVVALPLVLLILYPMQCFQKCLNKCGWNCEILRIFMQCFQGCYRDRTDGGLECRYFAAVYPFSRLIAFLLYGSTHNEVLFSAFAIISIGLSIIVFTVQPYKHMFKLYNKVDGVMLLLLAMFSLGIIIANDNKSQNPLVAWPHYGVALLSAVSVVPLVYIFLVILSQIFPHQRRVQIFRLLQRLISQMCRGTHQQYNDSTDHLVAMAQPH